jgi:hypothetical protein
MQAILCSLAREVTASNKIFEIFFYIADCHCFFLLSAKNLGETQLQNTIPALWRAKFLLIMLKVSQSLKFYHCDADSCVFR